MRLEWNRDGTAILACASGRARIVDGTGATTVELDGTVLDARWTPRGVLSIDKWSTIRCHDGAAVIETRSLGTDYVADAASLAAGGWRFARKFQTWSVHSATGVELWAYKHRLGPTQAAATLSDDGRRIAVAYAGGWSVYDVETGKTVDKASCEPTAGPRAIAFDGPATQLGYASPDWTPGVARLGTQHAIARGDGPHAVALDSRGVLAAFAYAVRQPGTTGRLRIDNLDGGDTFFFESDLPDLAAIAFAPDSHRMACLAADGTVEVLPVP